MNVAGGLQAGRRDGLKPVAYGHVKNALAVGGWHL